MALGRMALALAALLAYQNRDRLGSLLSGSREEGSDPSKSQSGGIFDGISKALNGGGLSDILDRFRGAGSGDTVDTWVKDGPNQPIQPAEVEAAIDPQTLSELSQQTGLSREELLRRLANELPQAVDRLTPEGVVPDEPVRPSEPNLLDDVPIAPSAATGPKIG